MLCQSNISMSEGIHQDQIAIYSSVLIGYLLIWAQQLHRQLVNDGLTLEVGQC